MKFIDIRFIISQYPFNGWDSTKEKTAYLNINYISSINLEDCSICMNNGRCYSYVHPDDIGKIIQIVNSNNNIVTI